MPRGARGSSQRGVCRQRLVLRTQATIFAALPGIQSSAIVQFTDGVACCRLTSHSSGRLRRRLIPALGIMTDIFLNFLKEYPYIPGTAVVAFGWWCVHRLNSARDRINSERTIRTTELAKVYAILLRTGIYGTLTKTDETGKVTWINEELEDAIGKIYLYGTNELVALTQQYVESWSKTQGANGTELLNNIRDHIRKSLGLDPIVGTPHYLRVTINRNKKSDA
jgi:hypothetical protein